MGSPASPALAVALCMKAEHTWLSTLSHGDRKGVLGFRYMDDLLVFHSPQIKQQSLTTIFPHPLSLELEDIHNNSFRFLQTWVHLRPNNTMDIQFYHKNTVRKEEHKPLLKSVVPFDSHWPKHMHLGRVIGALHGVYHHVNSDFNVHKGTMQLMAEFKDLGLTHSMLHTALSRLHKQTKSRGFKTALSVLTRSKKSRHLFER